MGQMQDKILSEVKKYAEASDLEFVQTADFSNVGTIFFMKGLSCEFTMTYMFNGDTASLQFYRKGTKPQRTCGFTHKDCLLNTYLKFFEKGLAEKMEEVQKLISVCSDTSGNPVWERD